MIESLVTRQQKVEMDNGLGNYTVRWPLHKVQLEARLTPQERAIRRRMVVERHAFLDTLMVERPYPWINNVKRDGLFEVVDSGQELLPLPSHRDDGQIHDWKHRTWCGKRWLPIAVAAPGVLVEAQVRHYIGDESLAVSERRPLDLGIHTRLHNVADQLVGSSAEAFAFHNLVPGDQTLTKITAPDIADITYRSDSMAPDAEEWSVLDGTLVMLHQGFTGGRQPIPTLDRLARLAIAM